MFARRRSFLLSFYMTRRTGMQLSFIFISIILQFHGAFASPTDPWQFSDEVGASGFPGQYVAKGYECGNEFFSDNDIKEALFMYHKYVNQNGHSPLIYHAPPAYPNIQQYPHDHQELSDPLEMEDLDILQYFDDEEFNIQRFFTPILYQGPLYSDSWSSNYILWPIKKEKMIDPFTKYSSDPYYIVIKKHNGEFIDVISKIKNNDHTKCIRIDGSGTESSATAPDRNNGYQCGHEFLSDELIQKSLHLVLDNTGKSNIYPAPFVGRLYPANNGYMIWPIFSRDGLYDYGSVEAGPYFLVIDMSGKLIGTVVEGLSKNFLRCPRSRKLSKTPPSNAPNHSSELVPTSQHGYLCGRVRFSENAVMEAVKAAKFAREFERSRRIPSVYNGPPLYEPVLLWPLMEDGRLYDRGWLGRYRVVLSNDFQLKGVGIMQKNEIHFCEKCMMERGTDHEKSNYYCFNHVVTNLDLVEAAEGACDSLINKNNKVFPAKYEGPEFDKSGPYYTYPVWRNKKFTKHPGRDRVVINLKCEVVGAITSIPDNVAKNRGKRFVLCIKSAENPPGKTYIVPDVPINERPRKGRY